MKTFYMSLLLCLIVFTARSQNSISGTVTAAGSNEPLLAAIYIPQLEIGTETDLNGYYELKGIPTGTFTVVCSFLGYATYSEKFSFSGENTSLTIDIEMEESAVEMAQVIIAAPFHKLQRDNVMKVERLSVDELSKSGATTLSEGITTIAGVESISTGVGIGKPVIRGLSANRVLTYAQGVRLENQQFGDEHGLGLNASGTGSVEVIKGPASLLYGSDALGGVLYFNPEPFAAVGKTTADATATYFSNTQGYSFNAGAQTSGEKLKFLARVAYDAHSDYEAGDGTRVTNSRFNETDLKTGLRYQGNKVKSTFRYNYNRANIGIPEELGAQTTEKKPVEPYQEIDNHILSLENNHFFNNSSLDVKLGYIFNDRREFEEHEEGEPEEGPALQMKLNTLNYDVKYNLPDLGDFETIVGVQGMFQKNKNFGEEILIPDATVVDIGVLGTTHYHLEKIDIQAGLRYDIRKLDSDAAFTLEGEMFIPALERDFNSFNAALGAKFDIDKQLSGRVNLASGFRAPNLAELTSNGVHEGTNRYEVGNPNLDNEQNLQLDVSLEYGNEHVEIFANGFYNLVDNFIFILPTGEMIDDNFVFNYVQDDSKLYGGEFGLHLHPHPLDWLHLESSFQTVTGEMDNGENLPLIPANSIRNTLNVEFGANKFFKQSEAFVTLLSVMDQDNTSASELRTGGYSLVNLGASASLQLNATTVDLRFAITNIFNKEYISHLSRLKSDGIMNMGRNITGTVIIGI
ncbi:TonB-dependent receptor [Pukyongia salina]|uniref:TonB-dependent receptor n=1 Tax=Pukyongia salina TaxID=2094025 RepID=A0A2S0I0R4_9FLAO|nr:TonB-dependent receptor [Pukyongia salina]AVI52083.1 TonB-dependent receptor [Pukyongia salina]